MDLWFFFDVEGAMRDDEALGQRAGLVGVKLRWMRIWKEARCVGVEKEEGGGGYAKRGMKVGMRRLGKVVDMRAATCMGWV